MERWLGVLTKEGEGGNSSALVALKHLHRIKLYMKKITQNEKLKMTLN